MIGFDISIPAGVWVDNEKDALEWIEYYKKAAKKRGSLGIDSETTGINTRKDFVVIWSLSDGETRICLPASLLPLFKEPLLENPEINFDFTNAKFDAHMFANTGIDLTKAGEWRDTTVQSWILNENNMGRHGLKECIQDHFGRVTPTFEQTFGKIQKPTKANPHPKTHGEIIREACENAETRIKAMDYASLDAYNTTSLREFFDDKLKDAGLFELFYSIEVPFTKVLYLMERRGITVDGGYLYDLEGPMKEELDRIGKEFTKEAGRVLNLNSTKDIRWFFIEHLNNKVVKMTKGGKTGVKQASTDGDVLEKWAEDGDPWAKKMLKQRSIAKIYGTYVTGLKEHIDPYYRIHTELKQTGTVTGRLSSKDPNLQNIPRASEDQFVIRDAFIAGYHKTLIVADYAQLEMRLMAHFSGDEKMIDAINKGIDLHCLTVSEMHNIPYDEVIGAVKAEKLQKKNADKKEYGELGRPLTEREEELLFMRQCAKATGFGIIYGIAGKRLAEGLTSASAEAAKKAGKTEYKVVTEEEGYELIEKWFSVFPGVRAYIEYTHAAMHKSGHVQTITGRYRRFGDVKGMSFKDKGQAERQSVNSIIQGSAADIAKVVMILAEQDEVLRELGASLLLQVHDELIWECPDDEETVKKVKERIKVLMENPFGTPLKVPLPVEAGHGLSWAKAK